MFKFFRKYNKIILAVGGSLLMVIFLLPNASGMFQPDPGKIPIGHLTAGGKTIELRVHDTRAAEGELAILNALGQFNLRLPSPVGVSDEQALRWAMMLHEAEAHGLYGSDVHTDAVFRELEVGPRKIAQVKAHYTVPDSVIYQAMRHWQMVQQLQQLVLGIRRVSEPQLRHFANDLQSSAAVEVVPLRARKMAVDAPKPSDAELTSQFERYKAQSPGSSEPYGFGYRLPARVKLEYLAVPLQRVATMVTVNEVDAAHYYQQHTDRFIPESDDEDGEAAEDEAPTQPRPFKDVLPDIIEQLTRDRARDKRDRIVKWAAAIVLEEERKLQRDNGYRAVPADYVPMDLEELARQVQEEFGVLPDVVRLDDQWYTLGQLSAFAGIGQAHLQVGSGDTARWLPFAQYVASCRELNAQENPLKLQEKLLSDPVYDFQRDEQGAVTTRPSGQPVLRNAYLFRVTNAEAPRNPVVIGEVIDQVTADVKALKVYTQLKDQAKRYVDLAAADGMEELAKSIGHDVDVYPIGPFPRRQLDRGRTEQMVVPRLPVIGREAKFVDAAFALARRVEQAGGVETAPAQTKIDAIPIDSQLTVYVTQVSDYQPVTTDRYEMFKMIQAELGLIQKLDGQRLTSDPFSLETLRQRLQFVEAQQDEPEEPQA